MSDNQPPSYPGEPSGQQPDPSQPYAPPPAPGYAGQYAPKHPQATTVLVLGILSLVVCGLLGPFAWAMGNRALREIDANPGAYQGRSEANAGRICGIIATVLLILVVVLMVVAVTFGIIAASTSSDGDYSSYALIGALS